MENAVISVQIL